jgi:hypothetical protein
MLDDPEHDICDRHYSLSYSDEDFETRDNYGEGHDSDTA